MTDADLARSPSLTTGPGFLSSGSTPLPADILARARERVRIAALVFVGTWLFVLVMNEGVRRFSPDVADLRIVWTRHDSVITVLALALAAGFAWIIPRVKQSERVLDLGLWFEVMNAVMVSLITEHFPRQDPQAVSWICVTILLWPALAPSSPRKTFLAALASATTIPLALYYAHLSNPQYNPPWFLVLWLILPAYICAVLAIIPATVIRGLSRQVRKARELGSYQLEDLIGKGGMGEVYRARHRLLARPAAVKLISPVALRASSPEQNRIVIERFRREAQAAATLRSPHTIELYDYGIAEDGTFYYVMELLDGINFQELVQKHGPLPAERVAHLLIQACDSLGEAHLAGLVHRDVKPSNLLACRMGLNVDFVKVVDFGLVKNDPDHATSGSDITSEGSVSGTPAFMAPESVSGMDSVGPPADVYALGCVAYWLLTGQNVFKAANPTMMLLQHVQASPVPPSLKAPKPVPRDLEDIVMRCLSKAPEDRPPNAAELAGLLVKSRTAVSWTDARAGGWWTSHHEARLDTVRSSVAASTDS